MTLTDRAGAPLSTSHADARDAFDRAVELFHGYYGDPVAVIDEALQAQPDFLMGYALKAGLLLTATDRRLHPLIGETLAAADRHANAAGERERGHLAAAQAWLAGDWQRANVLYGEVLRQFPRDALAMQLAHLGDFFLGQSRHLRDRTETVLRHWDAATPGYGYLLGMHAFGLEECGEYARAEAAGRAALELNRRDPWAVHAVAHVFEMQCRLDEGVDWLERRREDWVPDNGFAFHNWWHLALYWLELGEHARVLQLYDEGIRPHDDDVVLELIDATAMLWRLHLRGVDVGERWQPVLACWQARAGDVLYAFNDIHAMLAQIACGRIGDARALARSLAEQARGIGAQAEPARAAAAAIARGLLAFGERRYAHALPDLIDAHRTAAVIGGSHAQRDLFALTALTCAERAGARDAARDLAEARRDAKPNSPFAWSAIARWRWEHDSNTSATYAQRQAEHAQREWLRRLQPAPAKAA